MLRAVMGGELAGLVPAEDRYGRLIALGLVGAELADGELRDMDPREATLLKRLGLAEAAPERSMNPTSPAALAQRFGKTEEKA